MADKTYKFVCVVCGFEVEVLELGYTLLTFIRL